MTEKNYNSYLKKLEKGVAEGLMPLFVWYRRIGMAHVNGNLTKSEFKKLLNKGKQFEV